MIKNVVFDVGQVLVTFDPPKYMKDLGYSQEVIDALMKAMFSHPLWGELDRSLHTKAELMEMFVSNAPEYEKEIRDVFGSIENSAKPQPYVIEWMEDLKKRGVGMYVVSNYAEFMYEGTKHTMLFLPYMDGVMFSYMCHAIKPEREIFETLLNKYNLKAEECVFIDDRADNVEGAKAVGFSGIQFHSYAQAKEELEKYLAPMGK